MIFLRSERPLSDSAALHPGYELEARRCAKAMGLRIIGTLGVVGRANAVGRIAQAAPVIEHLRRTGLHFLDALVQPILREVGE